MYRCYIFNPMLNNARPVGNFENLDQAIERVRGHLVNVRPCIYGQVLGPNGKPAFDSREPAGEQPGQHPPLSLRPGLGH